MSNKNVAIIDFGSEKITVLIGQREVNKSIFLSCKAEVTYEGFSDGQFLEQKNLEKAIFDILKNAEQNIGKKIKEITVGVPAEFCCSLCKNVSQSFLKPQKITKRDVQNLFKMANEFDKVKTHKVINQDSVYFVLGENNRVGNSIGQIDTKITACLSFVLVEKKFYDLIQKILQKKGIQKINFVSQTFAQSLYLFDDEQRDRYALLVDCGYLTTSVSLARGRGLLNMSSFSLGGGHISADLSKCLKIPFSSAESLSRKIVLCVEPSNNDMYDLYVDGEVLPISMKVANAIAQSRIEVIAKAIMKCFDSWEYDFPDFIPIYLTGGGLSFMKGAKDILGNVLNKNVQVVSNPYSQLNKTNYSSSMAVLNFAIENC